LLVVAVAVEIIAVAVAVAGLLPLGQQPLRWQILQSLWGPQVRAAPALL
jgi:hypothetical protein